MSATLGNDVKALKKMVLHNAVRTLTFICDQCSSYVCDY